jgi:hypothetical protein
VSGRFKVGDHVTWACILCSNGCGVDIAVKDGRIVGVRSQNFEGARLHCVIPVTSRRS